MRSAFPDHLPGLRGYPTSKGKKRGGEGREEREGRGVKGREDGSP